MMSVSDTDVEHFRRGQLPEVAHFITQFQSHYLPGGELRTLRESNEGVIVSPSDLKAVFEYRDLIMAKERLEDEYFVAKEKGRANPVLLPLSRVQARTLEEQLESIQRHIQDCPERLTLIHRLLKRFEVWSTKMVAQQILLSPASGLIEENTKSTPCCFSPFLNLPSSKHFCEVLPDVSTSGSPVTKLPSAFHNFSASCCSLPLAPNKHTWKEFARISRMVSLLDSSALEKVYNSPCCMFDLKNKNKCKASYTQHHKFQPHDLVALWVRAQRNTQAMRQLCLLFEIQASGEKSSESVSVLGSGVRGRGKQLPVDVAGSHQNEGRGEALSFKAIFRGNPTYSRERIVEASTLVDRLVEWAVTNQTLFTYRHVSYHIQTARVRKQNKRRQVDELNKNPTKRMRLGSSDEVALHRLRSACRSYTLRWFARRNRKVATVLFSKYKNTLHLDIGCIEADRANANMLHGRVDDGISEYLSRPEIDEVTAYKKDRTLARIDRRLEIPHRFDGTITLNSQVQSLLDALGEAAQQHLDPRLIQAAKSDFQELHNHFLAPSTDVYDTASKLLHTKSESIESIAQTLSDVPSPWKCNCAHCDQAGAEDNELRTCVNCEQPYHEGCTSNSKGVLLDEIIRSYPPLEELCRIKLPDEVPIPDFRNDDGVIWTMEEMVIERPAKNTRTVEKLGLTVRNTEDCYETFEKLTAGIVPDLAQITCSDKKRGRSEYPLALKYNGSLITNVAEGNSFGHRAGMRPGDIICRLELLDFLRPEDAAKYKGSRSFDFQDISSKDRLELLKLHATKLRVRVMRPSKDILKASLDWYSRVRHINKARTEALNDPKSSTGVYSTLWYCGDCQDVSSIRESDRLQGVMKAAEYCRAVIRRIGMESYALPFETENIERIAEDNLSVVSLRRLDSMMTDIIDDHSALITGQSSSRAFAMPPWASSSGNRLTWAPADVEKGPMELLCGGMGVLFDSALTELSSKDRDIPAVKALFRHFLFAFSSWCVQALKTSPGTIGPPKIFRSMRPPWLHPSCIVCSGRPCGNGSKSICENTSCSSVANSFQFQMEDIGAEEVKNISKALKEYSERSSLVGTTLLVLPSDPLIIAVSKVLPIDHNDRPVEFIVASYLPTEFETEIWRGRSRDDGDKFKEGDGIFHLLPVVTAHQLTYLLERCQTRGKNRKLESESDLAWASLDVLNIPGVVRYSFAEIKKKVLESVGIRSAIQTAIIAGCRVPSTEQNGEVHFDSTVELLPLSDSRASDEGATLHDDMIESLLYGGGLPTIVRELIMENSSSSNTSNEVNNFCPRKEWMIVPASREYEFADSFGKSSPQAGLQSFNRLPKSAYAVLVPDNDDCLLAYSDLHFENQWERHTLDKLVQPKRLREPDQLDRKSRNNPECMKIILFVRTADISHTGYQGIGWGFELVQWKHEDLIRVGRICMESPAQRAGLRTNDIILVAGGKRINAFDLELLATTLLGAASSRVRIGESATDSDSDIQISKVLAVISASKCELDPVVLEVYRPPPMSYPREVPRSPNHRCASLPRVEEGAVQRSRSFAQESSVATRDVNDTRIAVTHQTMRPVTAVISSWPSVPNAYRDTNPVSVPQSHQKTYSVGGAEHGSTTADAGSVVNRCSQPVFTGILPLNPLFQIVKETYPHRPYWDADNLYFPAKNGIIFTIAEVALFLECLLRQQPKLGVRLLCPRYTTFAVTEQIDIMKTWTFAVVMQVPKLPGELFLHMMKLDFKRATNSSFPEVGPFVFKEANPRGGNPPVFGYRLPVDRLPVDRCLEKFLVNQLKKQQESAAQQLQLQSSYENYVDLTSERIRGGGVSTEELSQEETCLSDIPVERWRGLPVYAIVEPPEYGGEDKMLVGFAKPPEDTELTSLMTLEVEAHYLQDLGFFEDVQMVSAPSDELFVIDMNSNSGDCAEAASVIRELYATDKGPRLTRDTQDHELADQSLPCKAQNESKSDLSLRNNQPQPVEFGSESRPELSALNKVPQTGEISEEHSSESSPQGNLADSTESTADSHPAPAEDAGVVKPTNALRNPLSSEQMSEHINFLGDLPDGRRCFWMVNDPTALYISSQSIGPREIKKISEKQYLSFLKDQQGSDSASSPMLTASHTDRHYCPWGCSFENMSQPSEEIRREALSFESTQQLDEHYAKFHAFGLLSDTVELGSSERCVRVHGGQVICDLCADLAAAICARSRTFLKATVEGDTSSGYTQPGTLFSKSPSGHRLSLVMNDGLRQTVTQLAAEPRAPNSSSIASLFQLWDRICHLFEIEQTGLFRYTHDELLKSIFARGANHGPSRKVNCEIHSCDDKKSDYDSRKGHVGCSLCTLPWEKTIAWTDSSAEGGREPSDAETYFGAGCSLINNLIRSGGSSSDDMKVVPGYLGDAKSLLLQVASKVPDSIKLSDVSTPIDPLSGLRLWNDNYFDVWKSFVMDATCTAMLAQAFITLLTSIQKNRLPSWWNGEGTGWSTAQVVIASPRLSSLLLRVYVLDAAIAEFLCKALYTESREPLMTTTTAAATTTQTTRTVSGSTRTRMERYTKLADRLGYSRFNGNHTNECCICFDGGNLLCCELCKNVQHAGCCHPPIDDSADLEYWICDPCINDIETMIDSNIVVL